MKSTVKNSSISSDLVGHTMIDAVIDVYTTALFVLITIQVCSMVGAILYDFSPLLYPK